MERVSIDDVPPETHDPDNRSHDRRDLGEPLGTADVAVVRDVLEPGERFSGAVHAHPGQEEVVVVTEGEATFERPDGEVTVGAGGAIRFAPGEFQSGRNVGDGKVVAYALGAPREGGPVLIDRVPELGADVSCPECGLDHARATGNGLVCPECGAEFELQ